MTRRPPDAVAEPRWPADGSSARQPHSAVSSRASTSLATSISTFASRAVNRLLVLPERARYEIMDGNWSTYEKRVAQQEAAEREAATAAAAANDGNRPRRSQRSRDRKPTKPDDTSPYASWSLKRLEEAIMEREDHLSNTEMKFADPDVCKDAERARALRGVADTLRAELADLNAAWEGRAE